MEKIQQTRSGVEIGAESTLLTGKLKIFFGYAAGVGKTYDSHGLYRCFI